MMRLVFTIETGAAELGEHRPLLGRRSRDATQAEVPGVAESDPVAEIPAPPPRPAAAPPAPVIPELLEAAWEKLLEAQQRFAAELGKKPAVDRDRQMWVGGAMAMFAAVAGETEVEVGRRLGEAVPTETWHGIAVQRAHDIDRPATHAGAQRAVDPDDEPLPPDPGLEAFVTPPPPAED